MVVSEGYFGLLRGWQHRRHSEVNLSSVPYLHGKVALVTGANGGIAKVVTQVLAQKGAKVFMACRSKSKAEETMAQIRKENPEADLDFVAYDAASVATAHAAGISFLERDLPLDILILNAGTITEKPQASKDGLEWMFAVNHLAHFALTMAVMPALEKAARQHGGVRISTTASAGFGMHPDPTSLHIDSDELAVEDSKLWWKDTMPMYGRSKTCNILFAAELSRRLRNTEWGACVRSNAIHPGTVPTTFNDSLSNSWYLRSLERIVYLFASIPTEYGAINALFAVIADEVREKDITGKYLTPYGFVNSAPHGKAAGDSLLGEQLWRRSIQLCQQYVPGIKLPPL